MSDLAAALQIAIKVHADQRDKQGQPYLLHVLRVTEAVSDGAKVVAALHDVLEDSDIMLPQLTAACHLSGNETAALVILTRLPDETYAEYIETIALEANKIAIEVKIADLHDNLNRIPTEPNVSEPVIFKLDSYEEIQETAHDEWSHKWESLKKRYESALHNLEAT